MNKKPNEHLLEALTMLEQIRDAVIENDASSMAIHLGMEKCPIIQKFKIDYIKLCKIITGLQEEIDACE